MRSRVLHSVHCGAHCLGPKFCVLMGLKISFFVPVKNASTLLAKYPASAQLTFHEEKVYSCLRTMEA